MSGTCGLATVLGKSHQARGSDHRASSERLTANRAPRGIALCREMGSSDVPRIFGAPRAWRLSRLV
jgi:hypothetical protein